MRKINYPRLFSVALIGASLAFALFAIGSQAAWLIFPYPDNTDELQCQFIWFWHVFGEKLAQWVLLPVLAFTTARFHRPSWKIGVITAVLSAICFQLISIGVFVARFGFANYRECNSFWNTLLFTVAIAWLFGDLAVRRQRKSEKLHPSTTDAPANRLS